MKIETPKVQVNISPKGGFSPEDLARMATAKIISVSHSAPDPIRQQAEAFSVQVEQIIADTIRRAIQSDRAHLRQKLADVGGGSLLGKVE